MSRFLFSPYRASFCCNWEPPICQVTTPVAVLGISPQQYQEAPRCRHGHPHQRTYHAIVHQVRGSSQLERQGNPGIERVEFMNLLLYWVLYENELVWVFDHGMEYWVGLLLILEAPLGVSVLLTVQGFSCINDASTVTVSLNPKKQNPKEEWSIKTWEHLPTKFNPSAKKTEETKKKQQHTFNFWAHISIFSGLIAGSITWSIGDHHSLHGWKFVPEVLTTQAPPRNSPCLGI